MATDLISQREFARRIGVNERKIRYNISAGKLSKCVKYDESGKPKIVYSIGIAEAENLGLIKLKSEKPTKAMHPAKGNLTEQTIEPKSEEPGAMLVINSNASYIEAARIEKIARARKACTEAQILSGEFVEKAEVNLQLGEFAMIVRDRIQAIPDRETDTLISMAGNRELFHKHFTKVMFNALTELANWIVK